MVDDDLSSITLEELELALEKAYRRGFHQALTLLATFYPDGIHGKRLAELANEHLIWRRELGPSRLTDSAPPGFVDAASPLERRHRGG
jgi:hypothetical protein